MDDRFLQQLKKGVLELLVLDSICQGPTYGYALLTDLKEKTKGYFALKEGTLYPILYRLEDEGWIRSSWSAPEGRAAPKKIYSATPAGYRAQQLRRNIWRDFTNTVEDYLERGRNEE